MAEITASVIVYGGGRWGRTIVSVLLKILSKDSTIYWISKFSKNTLIEFLYSRESDVPTANVRIMSSLADIESDNLKFAFVANSPHLHFETTRECLSLGIPVFVEKPLCLTKQDAEVQLVDSRKNEIPLYVGLVYFFADYLWVFSRLFEPAEVSKVDIQWYDPGVEIRHGRVKCTDITTNKIHDIFPHKWTLTKVLMRDEQIQANSVLVKGDNVTTVNMVCGGVLVSAQITRWADSRTRIIRVYLKDGRIAELDFTTEPGKANIDGEKYDLKESWLRNPSPLTRELKSVICSLDSDGTVPSAIAAEHFLECVRLAEELAQMLEAEEIWHLVRCYKRDKQNGLTSPANSIMLLENICADLVRLGEGFDKNDEHLWNDVLKSAYEFLETEGKDSMRSAVGNATSYLGYVAKSPFLNKVFEAI
jgi:predicted dehydrogenase